MLTTRSVDRDYGILLFIVLLLFLLNNVVYLLLFAICQLDDNYGIQSFSKTNQNITLHTVRIRFIRLNKDSGVTSKQTTKQVAMPTFSN